MKCILVKYLLEVYGFAWNNMVKMKGKDQMVREIRIHIAHSVEI